MIEPQVILVDTDDKPIGQMGKQQAHIEGHLHRAFSILLVNSNKELLLQKRASSKYHSPGLWTNTCCSHPQPGENLNDAVNRRLQEELNIVTSTESIGAFIYKIKFEDGMIEHEYDHVYMGTYNSPLPAFNYDEVDDLKWVKWEHLEEQISVTPTEYTFWFKEICKKFKTEIQKYIDENL